MNTAATMIDQVLLKRRWVLHVGFWIVILLVYALFFGRSNHNYTQTLLLVGLLLPVTVAATYWINYILMPGYLLRGHYFRFGAYVIYTLLAGLIMQMIIILFTFILTASYNPRNMDPAALDFLFLLAAMMMVVFLGAAIKLSSHWRTSRIEYEKVAREKVEMELKFLRNQLHPHFLFNTLNNLYFLTLEKSDQAPKAILALSELLDYVLYETKTDFVPLRKELDQVNNFISLESLRYLDRLRINVGIDGPVSDRQVPPMLLVTLMENCFKHAVSKTSEPVEIELKVVTSERVTTILVSNNGVSDSAPAKEGVGLGNVRHRLQLLYGGRAEFNTSLVNGVFSVKLVVKEPV